MVSYMPPVEIVLPRDKMEFYLLNALAHDSALHDYGSKSNMSGDRFKDVFTSYPGLSSGGGPKYRSTATPGIVLGKSTLGRATESTNATKNARADRLANRRGLASDETPKSARAELMSDETPESARAELMSDETPECGASAETGVAETTNDLFSDPCYTGSALYSLSTDGKCADLVMLDVDGIEKIRDSILIKRILIFGLSPGYVHIQKGNVTYTYSPFDFDINFDGTRDIITIENRNSSLPSLVIVFRWDRAAIAVKIAAIAAAAHIPTSDIADVIAVIDYTAAHTADSATAAAVDAASAAVAAAVDKSSSFFINGIQYHKLSLSQPSPGSSPQPPPPPSPQPPPPPSAPAVRPDLSAWGYVLDAFIRNKMLMRVTQYGAYVKDALLGPYVADPSTFNTRFDLINQEDYEVVKQLTGAYNEERRTLGAAVIPREDLDLKLKKFCELCRVLGADYNKANSADDDVVMKYMIEWLMKNMPAYNEIIVQLQTFSSKLEMAISYANLGECSSYRCENKPVPELGTSTPFICAVNIKAVYKYLPDLLFNSQFITLLQYKGHLRDWVYLKKYIERVYKISDSHVIVGLDRLSDFMICLISSINDKIYTDTERVERVAARHFNNVRKEISNGFAEVFVKFKTDVTAGRDMTFEKCLEKIADVGKIREKILEVIFDDDDVAKQKYVDDAACSKSLVTSKHRADVDYINSALKAVRSTGHIPVQAVTPQQCVNTMNYNINLLREIIRDMERIPLIIFADYLVNDRKITLTCYKPISQLIDNEKDVEWVETHRKAVPAVAVPAVAVPMVGGAQSLTYTDLFTPAALTGKRTDSVSLAKIKTELKRMINSSNMSIANIAKHANVRTEYSTFDVNVLFENEFDDDLTNIVNGAMTYVQYADSLNAGGNGDFSVGDEKLGNAYVKIKNNAVANDASMSEIPDLCKTVADYYEILTPGDAVAYQTFIISLSKLCETMEKIIRAFDVTYKFTNIGNDLADLEAKLPWMFNVVVFCNKWVFTGFCKAMEDDVGKRFNTATQGFLYKYDLNDFRLNFGIYLRYTGLVCQAYINAAKTVRNFFDSTGGLDDNQVAVAGYAMGAVLISVLTEITPSLTGSTIVDIERDFIIKSLEKTVDYHNLKTFAFGDSDTKLIKSFTTYLNTNPPNPLTKFFVNHKATSSANAPNMFNTISGIKGSGWTTPPWFTQVMTDSMTNSDSKFYINNAVSDKTSLGAIAGDHFCPVASIIDGQSTCTWGKARTTDGFEYGTTDILIRSDDLQMSYRIRVDFDPTLIVDVLEY